MDISIVIPTLNEAVALPLLLGDLQPLRARGAEIIVVDGGSRDASLNAATNLADQVIQCTPGRATQLNVGARVARGQVLLFLHADTRFSSDCVGALEQFVVRRAGWGFFRVVLQGDSRWLPVVARCMWWRSRSTGIATGDQGLVLTRSLFDAVNGFPQQPLMEDVEICTRLRKLARPDALDVALQSSGRRWVRDGAVRTIVLMWWLRLRYFLGADPASLQRSYYG